MENLKARIAIILLLAGSAPEAAESEMITDRPDQTESSAVVPAGRFQFELGWTHSEIGSGGSSDTIDSVPETVLRIGLREPLELRVGFQGYRWTDGPDERGNSSLGFKLRLLEERGGRPAVSLLASASLPTGNSPLSGERVDPSFRLTFANTLTDRLSLGFNTGVAWSSAADVSGEKHTLSVLEWTLALGIAAGERSGCFVELFGASKLSADGSASTLVDGGWTFLLRENVQLDAFGGTDLSGSDEWFAGLGLSFRLPR